MIEISGLVVEFGAFRAVDALSLQVPEGSLYGLLGPNGAGKSTTINCIAGLLSPTAGQIRLDGLDPQSVPQDVRARLGVVPQRLALYTTLSVRRNLQIFGGLMGLRGARLADRVDWGLALSQLADRADAKVGTLSGGMQRRLNLAAALLHDPPVIICDEPTTGVDPQSRNHLFETIRQLHADGRTVIYTTHYMEEVEALCERVAILDHGRCIAEDRLDALLEAGDAADLSLRLVDPAMRDRVAEVLAHAGIDAQVTARARSLETVFLELTGRALRDEAG
jgi:ABC-2 type transport system ATP-binding protein